MPSLFIVVIVDFTIFVFNICTSLFKLSIHSLYYIFAFTSWIFPLPMISYILS